MKALKLRFIDRNFQTYLKIWWARHQLSRFRQRQIVKWSLFFANCNDTSTFIQKLGGYCVTDVNRWMSTNSIKQIILSRPVDMYATTRVTRSSSYSVVWSESWEIMPQLLVLPVFLPQTEPLYAAVVGRHHNHEPGPYSIAPCLRLIAPRQRLAGKALESWQTWSSPLLRGPPGLRFHDWWGGRPSDASTWQRRASLTGKLSDKRAVWKLKTSTLCNCEGASWKVTRQFLSNFPRLYYCAINCTELRKRITSINCQKA